MLSYLTIISLHTVCSVIFNSIIYYKPSEAIRLHVGAVGGSDCGPECYVPVIIGLLALISISTVAKHYLRKYRESKAQPTVASANEMGQQQQPVVNSSPNTTVQNNAVFVQPAGAMGLQQQQPVYYQVVSNVNQHQYQSHVTQPIPQQSTAMMYAAATTVGGPSYPAASYPASNPQMQPVVHTSSPIVSPMLYPTVRDSTDHASHQAAYSNSAAPIVNSISVHDAGKEPQPGVSAPVPPPPEFTSANYSEIPLSTATPQ
ncbi:hypothetical protein BDF19DRAFT_442258 [Syncephalis fuscata]|nr:hypothetical protein BDF19DRAFT_442258 [Syncephalis fuscata]